MILDPLFGLFSRDMGIDLGTATTLVAVRGEGVILCEPSVVAVQKGTNRVLLDGAAVGDMAKEMIGKTPGNIVAIRPLKDGVIADFDVTQSMLSYFIRKVHTRKRWIKPRIVVSIPSGITAVEERAVYDSALAAGARQVTLLDEPTAAAIGVGLPINEAIGSMIVDIGGGTTEVAVISLANVVTSESMRVAGDEMDEAIIQHMKRTYNMMIGERMAERIKIQIGSAYTLDEEMTMEVRGRDLVAGLPRATTVTSEEIRECLKEPVDAIVGAIKVTLERTPPELAADLVERGMVLAGGGALLRGVDKVIGERTGMMVKVDPDPVTAVAKGCAEILEHLDKYGDIFSSRRH